MVNSKGEKWTFIFYFFSVDQEASPLTREMLVLKHLDNEELKLHSFFERRRGLDVF